MATEGDRDSTNRSSRTRILFASALELAIYIIPLIIIITIHFSEFQQTLHWIGRLDVSAERDQSADQLRQMDIKAAAEAQAAQAAFFGQLTSPEVLGLAFAAALSTLSFLLTQTTPLVGFLLRNSSGSIASKLFPMLGETRKGLEDPPASV
jgi:hypothetical protein